MVDELHAIATPKNAWPHWLLPFLIKSFLGTILGTVLGDAAESFGLGLGGHGSVTSESPHSFHTLARPRNDMELAEERGTGQSAQNPTAPSNTEHSPIVKLTELPPARHE